MTIKELYLQKKISIWALRTCHLNEIKTIAELKEYYKTNGSLKHLKKCGKKIDSELVVICLEFLDLEEESDKTQDLYSNLNIVDIVSKFDENEITLVNNLIRFEFLQLSIRSSNALVRFLTGDISINALNNNVFKDNNFNLNSINNLGPKSIPEVRIFLKEIKRFIHEVYNKSEYDELTFLKLKFLLKSHFNSLDISEHLQDSSSILKLVNILIDQNQLFNQVDTIILKKGFRLYEINAYIENKEIGNEINLTRERVRQKKIEIFEKLNSELQFFKNFDKGLLSRYLTNGEDELILISTENAKFINSIDGTIFSKQFITFIFHVFYQNEYKMIGNIEDALILRKVYSKNRHNWKSIYLVKNELLKSIDIERFIDDIDYRINERKEETYKFNFKTYLSRFLKIEDYTFLDEIVSVCKRILFEEFNLFLSLEEEIVFERNIIKTIPEYAYEALELLGKPSHVSEIDKQVKVLYPDFDKTVSNGSLKREFGFVPFGRQSIFCLKKWEEEFENIKGGTIKDIAEEYLLDCSDPRSIKDVTEYVLKYRPESNENSISHNLRMDKSNRFLFLNNAFIGLKSKKYIKRTINDIAEEYLSNCSEQISLEEVSLYILKIRPEIDKNRIRPILLCDKKNRFLFFKDTFIGLKNKIYNLPENELLDPNEIKHVNHDILDSNLTTPIKSKINSKLKKQYTSKEVKIADYGLWSLIEHISYAIELDVNIKFNYQKSLEFERGIKSLRTIKPKSLEVIGDSECVVGYCYLRNEDRTFNISRIHKLIINPTKIEYWSKE